MWRNRLANSFNNSISIHLLFISSIFPSSDFSSKWCILKWKRKTCSKHAVWAVLIGYACWLTYLKKFKLDCMYLRQLLAFIISKGSFTSIVFCFFNAILWLDAVTEVCVTLWFSFWSICKILVALVCELRETKWIGLQSKTTCKVRRVLISALVVLLSLLFTARVAFYLRVCAL